MDLLNKSPVDGPRFKTAALMKLYACFLVLEEFFFHRPEDVRYQCLAQLAGELDPEYSFDDYCACRDAICDKINEYISVWDSRRLRFVDCPDVGPTNEDLFVFFPIVTSDIRNDGYVIDPIVLFDQTVLYLKDFAPAKKSDESSHTIGSSSSTASPHTKTNDSLLSFWVVVLILSVCFLVCAIGGSLSPAASSSTKSSASSHVSSTSRSTSSSVSSSPSLTPISKPKTGLVYRSSYEDELAPFTVVANSDTDYYLRLCQGHKIIRAYYIHAGETLDVEVPLGTYSLNYACSPYTSSWFGKEHLWGTHTSFYKSLDSWTFYVDDDYYNGYTLTLKKPTGSGNTEVRHFSENDWNVFY